MLYVIIKCMFVCSPQKHPQTPLLVHGTSLRKTSPWCKKGWEPPIEHHLVCLFITEFIQHDFFPFYCEQHVTAGQSLNPRSSSWD